MDSKVCVFLLVALLGVALALAGPIAGGSMEAVLAGKRQPISPSSLDPNRAACIGSCPAAGGAYTGRGC
ncbi:uncharacterized protein C2845_PM16G05390 [Panicum miliaceum]|uniref:Uncharacterized protein n=1 Tax=Panicum miliaceum TaxID=4540 RepID=A0A3L6PVM7_PANMI|nr:uncharacterized protein C2845_PM16G05390 [Panicum miliaceum]